MSTRVIPPGTRRISFVRCNALPYDVTASISYPLERPIIGWILKKSRSVLSCGQKRLAQIE